MSAPHTQRRSGRYSVFAIAREAMRLHSGWGRAWASPEPRSRYQVVIVGAGGHGLATAYYLGKNFGITDVAVIEKGWLGGGNTGRNTTIIRSNYLYDESAKLYDHALDLWDNLSQELNYNVMYSKRGVMMLAHTASSYTLGRNAEAELVKRMQAEYRTTVATAFGSVVAALQALGVKRIALGAPYTMEITLKGKALLEEHGFAVVSHGVLENVTNIFDETPERAYRLGRAVNTPQAEAVFLSGLGMPTIPILQTLEQDLGKPVISAASAMMWNALQLAGVRNHVPGYGRLLAATS